MTQSLQKLSTPRHRVVIQTGTSLRDNDAHVCATLTLECQTLIKLTTHAGNTAFLSSSASPLLSTFSYFLLDAVSSVFLLLELSVFQ